MQLYRSSVDIMSTPDTLLDALAYFDAHRTDEIDVPYLFTGLEMLQADFWSAVKMKCGLFAA